MQFNLIHSKTCQIIRQRSLLDDLLSIRKGYRMLTEKLSRKNLTKNFSKKYTRKISTYKIFPISVVFL